MRHYDPWVFGMLWEIDQREELRRLARARLTRQAQESQARESAASGARPTWSRVRQIVRGFIGWPWLRLPRSAPEAERGA